MVSTQPGDADPFFGCARALERHNPLKAPKQYVTEMFKHLRQSTAPSSTRQRSPFSPQGPQKPPVAHKLARAWLRRGLWTSAAWLCLSAAACQSGDAVQADGVPSAAKASAAEPLASFKDRLTTLLTERAVASTPASLSTSADGLHQPGVVQEGYQMAGQRLYIKGGQLSPHALALLGVLQDARNHGLNPQDYHLGKLEALLISLEERNANARAQLETPTPALTPQAEAALTPLAAQGDEALLEALLVSEHGADFVAWQNNASEALTAVEETSAKAELLLVDGALRYAHDMKHFNLHDVPDTDRISQSDKKLVTARQRTLMASLVAASAQNDGGAATTALMDALVPTNPQYKLLVWALAHYREIAAAGGWPVKMPRMKRPRRGQITRWSKRTRRPDNAVSLVKARLAGERLYDGPIDETWDEAFDLALLEYRKFNQLYAKAWIDYELLQAMKIPCDWRVAQLEVNLQRLREERIGKDDYYVHINIPEFHGELWDGGERKLRFRIVVGSRKRYQHKRTREWTFPDATPIFSDKMEQVVFSPSWTVPWRIRKEIMRKAENDPEYLEAHGYEVVVHGNGAEALRQTPGPHNALGKVKFLFPNKYDVYMHDTPKKGHFQNPVRAYSHGCMRVQDPLELAFYIVSKEDPSWTRRRVRINAGGRQSYRVNLSQGPAVHTDYITTKVHEGGRVEFMTDIYRLDMELIEKNYGIPAPDGL